MIVSRMTIGAKTVSGTSIASLIAIMLALPPTQLPTKAPTPFQVSSGRTGRKSEKDTMAPIMMPAAPNVIAAKAVLPSRKKMESFTGSSSKRRHAGRRY